MNTSSTPMLYTLEVMSNALRTAIVRPDLSESERERVVLRTYRDFSKELTPRALYLASCRESVQQAVAERFAIRHRRDSQERVTGTVVFRLEGDLVFVGASFCSPRDRHRFTRQESIARAYSRVQAVTRADWENADARAQLEGRWPRSMRRAVAAAIAYCWARADEKAVAHD